MNISDNTLRVMSAYADILYAAQAIVDADLEAFKAEDALSEIGSATVLVVDALNDIVARLDQLEADLPDLR